MHSCQRPCRLPQTYYMSIILGESTSNTSLSSSFSCLTSTLDLLLGESIDLDSGGASKGVPALCLPGVEGLLDASGVVTLGTDKIPMLLIRAWSSKSKKSIAMLTRRWRREEKGITTEDH
jgi:hypothetical protein